MIESSLNISAVGPTILNVEEVEAKENTKKSPENETKGKAISQQHDERLTEENHCNQEQRILQLEEDVKDAFRKSIELLDKLNEIKQEKRVGERTNLGLEISSNENL